MELENIGFFQVLEFYSECNTNTTLFPFSKDRFPHSSTSRNTYLMCFRNSYYKFIYDKMESGKASIISIWAVFPKFIQVFCSFFIMPVNILVKKRIDSTIKSNVIRSLKVLLIISFVPRNFKMRMSHPS